jgi:hypothetical protein
MSEDYRMSIFDAVAYALTFFYVKNKQENWPVAKGLKGSFPKIYHCG